MVTDDYPDPLGRIRIMSSTTSRDRDYYEWMMAMESKEDDIEEGEMPKKIKKQTTILIPKIIYSEEKIKELLRKISESDKWIEEVSYKENGFEIIYTPSVYGQTLEIEMEVKVISDKEREGIKERLIRLVKRFDRQKRVKKSN